MKQLFKMYTIGVLHSASFLLKAHHQDSIAEEMIGELLQGVTLKQLKILAKEEAIEIDWKKMPKLK